jgi:hypothetical protein
VAGIAVLLQNCQSDVFDTLLIVCHAVAAAHNRTVFAALEIARGSLATIRATTTCARRWAGVS